MPEFDLLFRLAVALAIGFLLGLERGWRERAERPGGRTAGVRTFSLLGLLGGIAAVLAQALGAVVFGLALLVTGAAVGAFMYREAVNDHDFSATSLVAALLTFLLGALAAVGDVRAAGAAAVAATMLLAFKEPLHSWLARLTWPELSSGLVLATMTFILLPVLPDRAVDPWGVLNPYRLWLLTILIAGVSFIGYAAVKLAGPRRGPLLGALAGGSVSSTAATLTFARLMRKNAGALHTLAASIVAATAAMALRVTVVAGLIEARLLPVLAPPLLGAMLGGGLFAGWLLTRHARHESAAALVIENPFELAEVGKFTAILVAILLATHAARSALGAPGMFAIAALSGVVDVDAITLAATTMLRTDGVIRLPALVIVTAVAANILGKIVLTAWVGTAALAGHVLMGTLVMLGGGLLGYALT